MTASALIAALVAVTSTNKAEPVIEVPADIDIRIDRALEKFHAHDHMAAATQLHEAFAVLPPTELRRETVLLYLAASLDELGFSQAAAELLSDLVIARRAPELMSPALERLTALSRKDLVPEDHLISDVLATYQFGELTGDTADFVEYHQALGDLRRGFTDWGERRLEELAANERFYSWKARYALAVQRLAQGNTEGGEVLFRAIVEGKSAPDAVKNDARIALARELYERKDWNGALELYVKVDSPLPLQDVVLLEKAWDRVAANDPHRALGMVVGLGAPVYRRLFAPERDLIRAMALRQLCQFRAAHLAVRDFHSRYDKVLNKLKRHESFLEEPLVRDSLQRNFRLLPAMRWKGVLTSEQNRLTDLDSKPLQKALAAIYAARLGKVDAELKRATGIAADQVAEQVLRIDEQLAIVDYEIGVGLFKSAEAKVSTKQEETSTDVPYGSQDAYFRFTGEYWSDEINNFRVVAEDRCVK